MKALRHIILLALALNTCTCTILAQEDFSWWNEKHNWDGITPWHEYMKIAPAYLGPNALPVPDFQNGRIPTKGYFMNAIDVHQSPGDQTQNLYSELYLPLFTERVGLRLNVVPIEFFAMDSITRDERFARDRDGKGMAGGDVYISTYIQLIQDHEKWPDLAMTINLRTASGTDLAAARYTDAPGYYFDLSLGKDLSLGDGVVRSIRPYLMGGLYVWQTYDAERRQNDAPHYALGFQLEVGSFIIDNGLGGYYGYIGEGDRPLVYRFNLSSNHPFWKHLRLQFQQGFHDFEYSSLRLGYVMNLNQ